MIQSKQEIYQHFSQEDDEFIDKVLEWLNRVEERYHIFVTPFLNPHQIMILKQLVNKTNLQVFSSTDYWELEEGRVILAPVYYQLKLDDFEMVLLEVSYARKFHTLRHSQVLGALLHQLGVERWTFGDILVAENGRIQIVVDQKMFQYFIDHISKIAKVPVTLKKIGFEELMVPKKTAVTEDFLVSSLRLDKLVAAVFHLSRKSATDIIAGRQVKVNYTVTDNVSKQVLLGDMISVRKFGRFRFLEEYGFSKNGKRKIKIEKLVSK